MRDHVGMRFRPATEADLYGLVLVQEEGAVVGLGHIFPQDQHPFPREAILQRWATELDDPTVDVYVSTDEAGGVTGFAARRNDELLHFGTAMSTWGTGLADDLHDALVDTYPAEVERLCLRVFTENHRARRFWEKHGWRATGRESRSPFAPHPVLLEYELNRAGHAEGP
jgi:RimJ/RimL family protein N-acetyltransferase